MTEERRKRISKFASKVLRHEPDLIGLELDADGYVMVDDLLAGMARKGLRVSREELVEVVETNDKRRFSFSEDRRRIRAVQGHSVKLEGSTVSPAAPPAVLYHGTADRNVGSILAQGLVPVSRIHVHLSLDIATATAVGKRHGRPVIFKIDAARANADGIIFYLAENGVWLCDALPPIYLTPIGESETVIREEATR
jgi:putative RNA 2'-phosphotransferase